MKVGSATHVSRSSPKIMIPGMDIPARLLLNSVSTVVDTEKSPNDRLGTSNGEDHAQPKY